MIVHQKNKTSCKLLLGVSTVHCSSIFDPTLREDQGIESLVIDLRGQVVFLRNKAQYGRYEWSPHSLQI